MHREALAALDAFSPRFAGTGGARLFDRAAQNEIGLAIQNEDMVFPGGMLFGLAVLVAGGNIGLRILVVQQQVLAIEAAGTGFEFLAGLGHDHIAVLRHRRRRQDGRADQNCREDPAHVRFPFGCFFESAQPHQISPGARCALATSGLRSKPRPGLSSIMK